MHWLPWLVTNRPNLLAEIRFEMVKGDPVAKAWICGQGPFNVLLDTGTAPSVIDLKLARRLGIPLAPTGSGADGGGSGVNLAFQTALPQLRVANCTLTHIEALANDLSGVGKAFGRPIDAVLGDSVFDKRVIQFDFPHHVARLYARSFKVKGRRLISAPFRHVEGEVRVRGARLNGKPVVVNIDTGANGLFSLTPHAIERLGLQAAARQSKAMKGTGFNGEFHGRSGQVDRFDFGRVHLKSPTVAFWLPGTGHDRPWDINVGKKFLKDYVVTIDYLHYRVVFQRP